tara:strand:- start:310 stop:459 length:150 start_codon:yes stop_codon:yes gene_type:complete
MDWYHHGLVSSVRQWTGASWNGVIGTAMDWVRSLYVIDCLSASQEFSDL